MAKNSGILHIYSTSPNREGVHIVGDKEGLYDLWLAVGESIISTKGRGSTDIQTGQGTHYPIHIIRVERKSNFLKQFIPADIQKYR